MLADKGYGLTSTEQQSTLARQVGEQLGRQGNRGIGHRNGVASYVGLTAHLFGCLQGQAGQQVQLRAAGAVLLSEGEGRFYLPHNLWLAEHLSQARSDPNRVPGRIMIPVLVARPLQFLQCYIPALRQPVADFFCAIAVGGAVSSVRLQVETMATSLMAGRSWRMSRSTVPDFLLGMRPAP